MFQDSLGNNIPFQGAGDDFIKALVTSLKSPVKDTRNKSEIDFVRDALNNTTKQFKDMQDTFKKALSDENKKILQNNSAVFNKIVKSLNDNIRNTKDPKHTKSEKTRETISKLARAGLKKGSIYTHDLRAGKYLLHISKTLVKIHSRINKTTGRSVIPSERKIDKWAKSLEGSTPGTGSRVLDAKDIGGLGKQFLYHAARDTESFLTNMLGAALSSLSDVRLTNLTDAFGEGVKFYKMMSETALVVDDISTKFGGLTSIQKNINLIEDAQYKTGLKRNILAKNYVKLIRMGLKDNQQAEKVLTAAGRAAYLLDLDAESTAAMFGEWAQQLGMGDRQIGMLNRSMHDTARLTGLMGDSLSHAVQSSKSMMEYMRNIDKLTASSTDSIIKLTAAGEKFGVGTQVQELQKLLGGGPVRAALGGSKFFTLFQHILGGAGLRGKFQAGEEILGNEKNVKQFGEGLKKQVKMLEKMTDAQRAAFAHTMGMEVGEIRQVLKAWAEATKTFEERLDDLNKKIAEEQRQPKTPMQQEKLLTLQGQKSNIVIDKVLREQTQILEGKKVAKGLQAEELAKAAQEVNNLAKTVTEQGRMKFGVNFKDKVAGIDFKEFGKLTAEKQLEFLTERREQIEIQLKKIQNPQEQANQWLEQIYDEIHQFGSSFAPLISPMAAFFAGAFGQQIAAAFAGIAGVLVGKMLPLPKLFGLGGGGAPVPPVPPIPGGGMKVPPAGGMKGAPAGGMKGGPGVPIKGKPGAPLNPFKATGVGGKLKAGGRLLGKVAGPLQLIGGAVTGAMEAEEYGRGKIAGATYGALTGGAGQGSFLSPHIGVERGSKTDQALGIAGAATHGALIGGSIGSLFGGVGAAPGAAIGAGIGTAAETFKIIADAYKEIDGIKQNITKDSNNRLLQEQSLVAKSQAKIQGIANPEAKLMALTERKKLIEDQISGSRKEIAGLQKESNDMWLWERWSSSNDKFIEEAQGKISLKEKELADINSQINDAETVASSAPKMSIEGLRNDRADKIKTEAEAYKNQNLENVASNTGDAVDILQNIQSLLTAILESNQENTNQVNSDSNIKNSGSPDFGRMVKNTRSGSINRNMTYTQIT